MLRFSIWVFWPFFVFEERQACFLSATNIHCACIHSSEH